MGLSYKSGLLLTFDSTVFSGGFELFIPVGKDGGVMAGEPVIGRDVADAGVKPDGIVMVDEVPDDLAGSPKIGPGAMRVGGV